MKALKTSIIVALFSLVFTSVSYAQSSERGERGERKEQPTFAQLLEQMDANEDGKLAKSELKGRLKENFAKIDTDEDGFISEKEYENAPKPERKKRQ